MSNPAIAVIGLPDLINPIQQSGYDLLSDQVDPATVASAARTAAAEGRTYVVLIAGNEPVLRVWARVQMTQGRRVLWLRSSDLESGDLPDQANVLDLPATLNEVLTSFGAPTTPEGDNLVINSDGSVSTPRPPLRIVAEPDLGTAELDEGVFDAYELDTHDLGANDSDTYEPDTTSHPPTPSATRPEARETDYLISEVPEDPSILTPAPPPARAKAKQCDVIVCFAGKGGVGKTTLSLALAQRAHKVGGLAKVVAADANRGQGDMRRILRVARSNLPSVYDAARTGDPKKALVTPESLTSARHPNLPVLGIGAILAPDDYQADPRQVTAAVYRDAIAEVRTVADLVVIDTQIVEANDLSGLIDHFVIPLLKDGAWGLGLTDSSISGADNLLRRLRDFDAKGVPRDRLMVAMNRKADESEISVEQLTELLAKYAGAYVGTISSRPEVNRAFEQGALPHDDAELAAVLDAVLQRVTGLAAFNRPAASSSSPSFFARLLKKRKQP